MLAIMSSTSCRLPFLGVSLMLLVVAVSCAATAVPESTARFIRRANRRGPFLGVVVPNAFEMEPLLRSPSFSPPAKGLPPYLDVAGTTHYDLHLHDEHNAFSTCTAVMTWHACLRSVRKFWSEIRRGLVAPAACMLFDRSSSKFSLARLFFYKKGELLF